MVTPGSLAMIQGSFGEKDRAAAIGAWSGLGGIAAAIGPFVGGVLIDYATWRWIFLINIPIAAATILAAQKWVPETKNPEDVGQFDIPGGLLAVVALAGTTYALIEWGNQAAPWAAVVGVVAAVAFVVAESRSTHPMMPLELFTEHTFSAANLMTFLVYAALGAVSFFLTLQLQTVSGYSALEAGVASLPIILCLLFLASSGGRLATRIGPRIPMTFGPVIMGVGTLMLLSVGRDPSYWIDVLPGLTVFGLGLALMVAPLTATVLAAAPDEHAGIASGINNAVARAGSLLAVAALPVAVGLGGAEYADPVAFNDAYRSATIICAVLLVVGGAISWVTIRNTLTDLAER